jgi:hypothetical protein
MTVAKLSSPVNKHAPAPLPTIATNTRQLRDVLADTWKAVLSANTNYYRFGNTIVRTATEPAPCRLEHANRDIIAGWLIRSANWIERKGKNWFPVHPPREIVADFLANPHSDLPALRAIVPSPVLVAPSEILLAPGYHRASKIIFAPPRGFNLPWHLSAQPPDREVELALQLVLDDLLGDFVFARASDRAHVVAAIVTPFVRHFITGPSPVVFICAPTAGTGKGLLADVIALVYSGEIVPVTTIADDEHETRKKLTAILLKGQPIVLIDNVKALDSIHLAAMWTSTTWSDRLLGQTKQIDVPNLATWIVTGNNPELSSELVRRAIRVRIDTDVERPEERTGFRHANLRQWTRDHRAELVWAVLTLIRRWIASGMPRCQVAMGSFDDWAGVVGGILQTAGVEGFLGNRDEFRASADREREEWAVFAARWSESFDEKEVTTTDLLRIAQDSHSLPSVLGDGPSNGSLSRLGKALRAQDGRIVDDLQIYSNYDSHRKARVHWLRRVRP